MLSNLASFILSFRPAPGKPDKPDDPGDINADNTPAIAPSETTVVTSKPGPSGKTYPHLSELPASLLPKTPSSPHDAARRLIIIGDVHGHLGALKALLRKAEFSTSRGDAVILVGDMVNKGPDSAGVVALAMEIGAFAVRGNHEERVLKAWERYESKQRARSAEKQDDGDATDQRSDAEETENVPDKTGSAQDKKSGKKKKSKDKGKEKKAKHKGRKSRAADLATAKSLTPAQRKWLSTRPLILHVGSLGPRYGDVVVVHAGLVPGIELESQDAEAVMNMRTLLPANSRSRSADQAHEHPNERDEEASKKSKSEKKKGKKGRKGNKPMIPSASRDGVPWAEVWCSSQTAPVTTVVYGHDAKSGLQMRKYAFGLDSGCGQDNTLTGVIFELSTAKAQAQGGEEEDQANGDADDEEEKEEANSDFDHANRKGKLRIRHRLVSVSCADSG
ncbi:Metallo-dependent phosphatase-like protein [Xylaria nigripes]|nr:Metallo-dependent phosphatase-like protein [Xylaria nigripes]